MPIYTKKGDKGGTSTLIGKISKSDCQTDVLGTLDELNSWVGFCRSENDNTLIEKELKRVQTNVMTIATGIAGGDSEIGSKETAHLEKLIDKLVADLPTLKNFVYPVGKLQLSRAVCRRAERETVRYFEQVMGSSGKKAKRILKYINRLSDALFCLARYDNKLNNRVEEIWKRQ